MGKTLASNNFLEQSKFILNQDIDNLDECPLNIKCKNCVVDKFIGTNISSCPPSIKIKASKHYLRNEKLKKLRK